MLVLRFGVLYTAAITRMFPMNAPKVMTGMAVVKNTETPLEQDWLPLGLM